MFKMIRKENETNADIEILTNAKNYDSFVSVKKRALIEEKIHVAVPIESPLAKKEKIELKNFNDSASDKMTLGDIIKSQMS